MSEESDSFVENECHLRQRGLYIQPAPRAIDLKTVPADGHEYIHQTRLESSLIEFPPFESKNKPNPSISKEKRVWVREAARGFSNFAGQLNANRTKLEKKYSTKNFPRVSKEKECCVFCLGSENYSSIYDRPCNTKKAHPPLLNYVIHLTEKEIDRMLKYSFRWFLSIGMDHFLSMWICALFACLIKPISSDLESFLEVFYDACQDYIKDAEGEELTRLHFISILLQQYFGVKYYKVGPSLN